MFQVDYKVIFLFLGYKIDKEYNLMDEITLKSSITDSNLFETQ